MVNFAVHRTFDCMDYNEHYYFVTHEEARLKFNELKQVSIDSGNIEETYTDEEDNFYVQESDGAVKIYIEKAEAEKFARKCDATGEGMNSGYVVGAGDLHFSEKEHLVKWLKGVATEEKLTFESDAAMLDHYYEEELYYYTEWYNDDECQDEWYTASGVLIESKSE